MSTQVAPSGSNDAYALIMRAVQDEKCDPAKLRELLAVRREWAQDQAASAFNAAVVEFQHQAKIVVKGDVANGRAYARMDRIWREIRPLMERTGLAVTWESVKTVGDTCILDGHLRHAQGHAQPLHHEMPLPEKINGQNASQRAGSGETYCKRYATCAALGIQTGTDDDGGPQAEPASDSAILDARTMLKDAGKPESSACKWLGIARLEDATAEQIARLVKTLVRK